MNSAHKTDLGRAARWQKTKASQITPSMKKKFNFPVVLLRQELPDGSIPKGEPIFCFKDEDERLNGRYVSWLERCDDERKANQRPVSAKERAEQL